MKLSRIVEFNTWWNDGRVREGLAPGYERHMLAAVMPTLSKRQVTVLRGPRRTGKSTMLYQAIRHLLSEGVDPKLILYYSFDASEGDVQELLDEYGNSILGAPLDGTGRKYVFLDEVQKCEGWAEQVKRNYDLYRNVKFVLSGSVSFDIGAGATESLAGRASEMVLSPMSFGEYLGMRGIAAPGIGSPLKEFLMAETTVASRFRHYLDTGGFPEIVAVDDPEEIKEYVLSSVVQRAVYGDLFQRGGIGDPESMMALLRAIAETPGMLLNYDRLGADIGRDRRTVSSYIARLEQAMIIRTIGNFRRSALSSSRKHRKASPVSTALTCAFKGPSLDEADIGRVVETAVLNEIGAGHFWRERGNEVDFVLGRRGGTAVEVKLGGGDPHFDRYARRHPVERAFVVTKAEAGSSSSGSVRYSKVPAWALCAGAGVDGIRASPL